MSLLTTLAQTPAEMSAFASVLARYGDFGFGVICFVVILAATRWIMGATIVKLITLAEILNATSQLLKEVQLLQNVGVNELRELLAKHGVSLKAPEK